MTKVQISDLLKQRLWTVTSVAERWGLSRRHVTSRMANISRGRLWDDAFCGLPEGPGLYRRLSRSKDLSSQIEGPCLFIGSLVASEAEMDTFGYGSRGVVVEILEFGEWRVVWDGGTVMDIDNSCLNDWVVDLGLRCSHWPSLVSVSDEKRISVAKMINLYD